MHLEHRLVAESNERRSQVARFGSPADVVRTPSTYRRAMKISEETEATVDTTLNTTARIHGVYHAQAPGCDVRSSACSATCGRAIVNGPSDGCWRSIDSATPLELLPRREQERLLAAGRLPNRR